MTWAKSESLRVMRSEMPRPAPRAGVTLEIVGCRRNADALRTSLGGQRQRIVSPARSPAIPT